MSWPATGLVFGTVLTFTGLMREIGARAGWHARALTGHQRDAILRRALAAGRLPGARGEDTAIHSGPAPRRRAT